MLYPRFSSKQQAPNKSYLRKALWKPRLNKLYVRQVESAPSAHLCFLSNHLLPQHSALPVGSFASNWPTPDCRLMTLANGSEFDHGNLALCKGLAIAAFTIELGLQGLGTSLLELFCMALVPQTSEQATP